MNSNMRKALGLPTRGHLALESEEPEAGGEKLEVAIKGPLSSIYTDALDIAFDKERSKEGDPTAQEEPPSETGQNVDPSAEEKSAETPAADPENENAEAGAPATTDQPVDATAAAVNAVVLESQAQDSALLQNLHDGIVDSEDPAESTEFMTLYAVDQSQVAPQNVIEVTELLDQAEDPADVTVLIDNVIPPNEGEEPSAEEKAVAEQSAGLATALEGIVVAMGGKVVRSFPEYLNSIRKV